MLPNSRAGSNRDGPRVGNIDASGFNFTPITNFTGSLNGNGYTITGLTINTSVQDLPNSSARDTGLFGTIETSGRVTNLKIINESITSNVDFVNAGGLAGVNHGIIDGVVTTGTVNSLGYAGIVGGLVGRNEPGDYTVISPSTPVITKSSSAADVSAVGQINTGNENTGVDGLVGGLVGWNAGIITQSYATGAVRDLSPTSILIGGLVGLNVDPIEQSYAMGAVTSVGATGVYATNIGGLVGVNQGVTQGVDYDHGSIDQSYATGLVTGSASYLHFGGITGGSSGGLTTNSYWDTQTTGLSSSAGGTGLTSDELKSGLPTGFDPAVWAISSDVNGGYPYLTRS